MKSILHIIPHIKRKPFEFKVVDYHLLEIIYFSCIIVLLKKKVGMASKSRKYFSEKELELIGNTDSALQLIGFNNIPIYIRGALYDQNYIINKLAYGIAIEQYKNGEISKADVEKCLNEYRKQKLLYEDFINNTWFAD